MRDDSTETGACAVAVPFTDFSCGVPAAAIDYNGHMNDAAYAQVLTDANELFLDALGLSAVVPRAHRVRDVHRRDHHQVLARGQCDGHASRASRVVASYDTKRLRVHSTLKVGGTDGGDWRLALPARRHRHGKGCGIP